MASIASMVNGSTSSLSSIYGSRNVLSGLASGMDTESMIENAISGIKTKIQNLTKKRTKIEWQQEAYRSIIDKAVNFNQKYTSYSSKTNLLSQSFFSNAVNTVTNGTYADKITASGKTSSDIKINAVKQMATAATYTHSGLGTEGMFDAITGGEAFDVSGTTKVSTISGTLTFQYGGTNGTTFDISFDELENVDEMEGSTAAEKLANAINNKLSEISYSYTKNGFQETTTADQAVRATANSDGTISFSDGLGNGNKVTISSATGNIKRTFGLSGSDNKTLRVGTGYDAKRLVEDKDTAQYLADKELSVTLDGVTKKISMSKILSSDTKGWEDGTTKEGFQKNLQKALDEAFGQGKVQVNQDSDTNKLSFKALKDGSTMSVGGSAAEALGFEKGDSNYVNTSKKLKDLVGGLFDKSSRLAAVGEVNTSKMVDQAGNKVARDQNGDFYRVDSDGKFLYNFNVNGTNINVTEDTTLESLMNSINSNADAGVKVSYSKLTNEFKFTATETGSNSQIKFDGLATKLFGDPSASSSVKELDKTSTLSSVMGENFKAGKFTVEVNGTALSADTSKDSSIEDTLNRLNQEIEKNSELKEKGVKASFDYDKNTFVFKDKDGKELNAKYGEGVAQDFVNAAKKNYVAGKDAVMDVEINGKRFENLTRSTNSFDIDGLTVNVKGTFNADGANKGKDGEDYEAITFKTSTDSDKIVETIREFVNDYNEMVTELRGAYNTMPAQKSNGARYEPLTAEQEDSYSESELAAYNEKAKQGILFGDSTLSGMYSRLLNAIQPGGTDGQTLREIGIGTSYNSGLTTLSLDEDKLRAALDSDPDKVKNAFAKTKESGSPSDGLMQTMQNTLNTYVKTTGEPKGVLITRAGSIKSPTSLNSNSLKSQMDSIDNQIERWENKMSDQIDRYTTQFSRLEQLIAQMNSQASAMSGLMGGASGY